MHVCICIYAATTSCLHTYNFHFAFLHKEKLICRMGERERASISNLKQK